MQICGVKGISLIDYPGKIAAVLYTSGCNFRCPFCHNRQLVLRENLQAVSIESVFEMLSARRGLIGGVAITGGEPTINPDIVEFTRNIRKAGLSVKVDTNGYNPDILEELLEARSVDFIAMDIKTSWGKYAQAAGREIDINRLKRSILLLKKAKIEYEFRTTCVPGLVTEEDIIEISRMIGSGADYTLQQFQPRGNLDAAFAGMEPYSADILHYFCEAASAGVRSCRVVGL